MGSWELLEESSQVAAIHAAVSPNGEVVYYSGNTGGAPPAETRVWNPTYREVRTPPNEAETDLFCSGLELLFDGRLLVVGGTSKYPAFEGDPWFGSKGAHLFDPLSGYERLPDMAFGRWYPTTVALPNGKILVVGGEGDAEVDGARTVQLELYDPFTGWEVLATEADRQLPLYPRMHLLANGEVAAVGQGGATAVLNLDTATWREIAPEQLALPPPMGGGAGPRARRPKRKGPDTVRHPGPHPEGDPAEHHPPDQHPPGHGPHRPPRPPLRQRLGHHLHPPGSQGSRRYDFSVLLGHPQDMRILNGGGGNPATNAVQVIDFWEEAPAWRSVAPMHYPRWFPLAVLLPDGTVFVTGGGRVENDDPVMEPEIFDPATETWTEDVPANVARLYHATALLLPDGRVWVAGTDHETRMELYSPDYLTAGERPVVYTAPVSVTYGQIFSIPMPDPAEIAAACFVRLSAVTHAFNMGQRYVPLDFAPTGPTELMVEAPLDPWLAPPGHYMLFLRNHAGVPAEAPIIQLVVT
jgi:hypothetical protein